MQKMNCQEYVQNFWDGIQGACIASVSLWEIGVKIQKGKLNIALISLVQNKN
jgi:PIN domain nuclease of toxin-antitoxin system